MEGNKLLLQPEYISLHTAMWDRCRRALYKASPAAIQAAAAARATAAAAAAQLPDLQQQPAFVSGAQLQPHQLKTVDWLRRMWAGGKHSIFADELGLGKTATVVTFLQCLM